MRCIVCTILDLLIAPEEVLASVECMGYHLYDGQKKTHFAILGVFCYFFSNGYVVNAIF